MTKSFPSPHEPAAKPKPEKRRVSIDTAPGTIVCLKSGGVAMTLCRVMSVNKVSTPNFIQPEALVDCVWHDNHGAPHGGTYRSDSLYIPRSVNITTPA